MVAVVNVLKAQKLYLKLIECAMNQRTMTFNDAHSVIHGEDRTTSDEGEVDETNIIVNYIAAMCREQHLPRLTALITSMRGGLPGVGFWKNLGMTGVDKEINDQARPSLHQLFVDECYTYYSGYCAHNPDIQQWVWDRVTAGLRFESIEGDFISEVVREYTLAMAQASTNMDQIHIPINNPLELAYVHKEFFLRMQEWLTEAVQPNEVGGWVWDTEFLQKSAKRLRREFTITVPLNQRWDLYALTLAKELKEGEVYCPYMDEVEMLTVCHITDHPRSIDHHPVKDGKLVKSLVGDTRQLAGGGRVDEEYIAATACPDKCVFQATSSDKYNYVTVRVSFRLG